MPEDILTSILLYKPQEIAKFVGGFYASLAAICIILVLWTDNTPKPK